MSDVTIPSTTHFFWPTLEVFQEAGGALTNDESADLVIERMGLTEEQQAVTYRTGSLAAYRVAWARTNLKRCGYLTNEDRAVWAITPEGRSATEEDLKQRLREVRRADRKAREARASDDEDADEEALGEPTWQDQLLGLMATMPPDAFERLCGRILRKAGFINVEVLGRPSDGGIDGVGVYRLSLVSFRVYFQCKRYASAVRASTVRDFRGAMVGRGDQGLLITTSHFTRDAEREAEREGATPIELVDGERLCELMLEHRVGLTATERIEYDVTVQPDFFDTV
jgi:restriction system protein